MLRFGPFDRGGRVSRENLAKLLGGKKEEENGPWPPDVGIVKDTIRFVIATGRFDEESNWQNCSTRRTRNPERQHNGHRQCTQQHKHHLPNIGAST